jgi:hypothetical protein
VTGSTAYSLGGRTMWRSRSMASAVSTCSWPMTVSWVTGADVSVQTSVEGA